MSNLELTTDTPAVDNSATTFDELDALTSDDTEGSLANEATAFIKEGGKEETSSEEDKSQYDEVSQKQEEEASGEEIEEANENTEEGVSGTFGDITKEYSKDTTFKHTVDGEEVDVSLQDLLDNYAGQQPWDKKFTELNQNKQEYDQSYKEFQAEKAEINDFLTEFGNKLQEGDAIGAMTYLAQLSGTEPAVFKEKMMAQIIPEVQRIQNMTPEQLKNQRLQEEIQYLREQKESASEKSEQEQSQQELVNRFEELQETLDLPPEAFEEAYQELRDEGIDPAELTPDAVADFIVYGQAEEFAKEIADKIIPNLANNEEVLDSIADMLFENDDITEDEAYELVKEAYGQVTQKTSKAVSDKVRNNNKGKGVYTTSNIQEQLEDIVSFEDF